ncbi:hypothetical protein F4804DRAFT_294398 [Jackrogersella minutella]|nr:hypothetical protein F4804DRAFT_294398 [Jackrogersella minutella]
MTAITKTTRDSDGTLTTLTYEMPSQTTPFIPGHTSGDSLTEMPSSCSLSVYCRSLSYYAYSMNTAAHNPHPLEGQHCLGVQANPGGGEVVGYNEQCWPENYFALFDNEWGDLNGAPRTRDEGSASTVAFPGDQCLAGWTTACTTTITADGLLMPRRRRRRGAEGALADEFPQAWCCPPGKWSCATATGDGDEQAPQRLCSSVLTGTDSTKVWMSWDPAYYTYTPDGTTSRYFEAYTWPADVPAESDPEHAATVFRKVFPLVLTSSGSESGDVSRPGAGGGELADAGEVPAVSDVETTAELGIPVTFRETDAVTTPGPPVLQGRAHVPLAIGEDGLAARCAVAGLLGAAVATAAVSLLGFGILHRRRNRDRRCRAAAAAAAAVGDGVAKGPFEDEKCGVGMGVQG